MTTGSFTPEIADRLRRSGAARLESSLALLREMVGINSFTLNPEGVEQVGQLTARAFAELGFTAEWVASAHPEFGRHLVLERRRAGGPVVGLISHLDTVFTEEEEARHDFRWMETGDRLYGPGTLDVKGGTVMVHLMLQLLREVTSEAFERVHWIFLLNSSEEMPSADFGQLCRDRLPTDALAALVMEGGARAGESHALVTARKGRALFQVEAHGRGAHAGNLHERGINAITQLAHTIRRIEALTHHDAGLTFNVGVVSGGSVVNRIPHHARAEVEMRAFDPEVFQSGLNALKALEQDVVVRSVEDGLPCRVTVTQLSGIPPWPRNAGTERLFRNWQETGRELGMTVVRQERGGLSDGNHLCAHVPTLDGLGPCGEHAHCSERSADGSKDQEYVERSSFVPRAVLNAAALLRLLGRFKK
ncbi:MAG: M20/M25/M40 family metallo-hydrolase [Verrucomicrobia bacterium]|nr:M20/M25/M40 family metallo-hydrolase [Verrucomicrobiota bacterium]